MIGEDDVPGAESAPSAWIEVSDRGGQIWAKVHIDGGKTNSTRHVQTRREVEDLAAQYGIDRHDITYADGVSLD